MDGFFQLLLFRKCNNGDHQSSKINDDHKGLIQFLAHSESPPLTGSKRKPCQLSYVNNIMCIKIIANIFLSDLKRIYHFAIKSIEEYFYFAPP